MIPEPKVVSRPVYEPTFPVTPGPTTFEAVYLNAITHESDRQECAKYSGGGLSADVSNHEGTPSKREDTPRDPRCRR